MGCSRAPSPGLIRCLVAGRVMPLAAGMPARCLAQELFEARACCVRPAILRYSLASASPPTPPTASRASKPSPASLALTLTGGAAGSRACVLCGRSGIGTANLAGLTVQGTRCTLCAKNLASCHQVFARSPPACSILGMGGTGPVPFSLGCQGTDVVLGFDVSGRGGARCVRCVQWVMGQAVG